MVLLQTFLISAVLLATPPKAAPARSVPPTPLADPLPAALTVEPPRPTAPVPTVAISAPQAAPPARLLPEDTSSVRVRVRRLAWNLAQRFKSVPGEGRFQTVAVLRFGEEGEETKKREIGKLVAAELATDLRRDHGLNLVEREKIDAALNEGYLNELGLVDEKKAVKLGQLLAAQALVVGNVSLAGNDFLINARIVSTESGAVFAAEQERLPAEGLVSFATDAVVLRTRSGAVFRSVLIPGWGQFYNRQDAKGLVFIGLALATFGTALGLHLAGVQEHGRYFASGDLTVQDQHINSERGMYSARNLALGLGGAVWGYNVLDAFLNGKTFDPAHGGD